MFLNSFSNNLNLNPRALAMRSTLDDNLSISAPCQVGKKSNVCQHHIEIL